MYALIKLKLGSLYNCFKIFLDILIFLDTPKTISYFVLHAIF